MKPRILLFVLFCFLCSFSFGQSWLWGKAASAVSEGNAVAVDNKGSAYLTGWYASGLTIDAFSLLGGGAFFIKMDSSSKVNWVEGGIPTGNGFCEGNADGVDKEFNAYMGGYFADTVSFGTVKLKTSVYMASFLVKYDVGGNVLWAEQSTGGYTVANSLAIDNKNNVYETGYFENTVNFGSTVLKTYSSMDMFLTKYNTSGNVVWSIQSIIPSKSSRCIANSVSTDKLGNVYVVGSYLDTVTFGTSTLVTKINQGSFLVKFDSSGKFNWVKNLNVDYTLAFAVTVDVFDNIYYTGTSWDSVNSVNTVVICKLDSKGNIIWSKNAIPIDGNDWYGCNINVDTNGNVFVGGRAASAFTSTYKLMFDKDTLVVSDNTGDTPSFITKFSSSGKYICGSIIGGGGDDQNSTVADISGKYIYLGGDMENTVIFGNDTINQKAGEIPFVARWQPCPISTDAINELSQTNSVTVYPNPSTGKFNLLIRSYELEIRNITVYNVMGEKIYSNELSTVNSQFSIDISDQPTGIYLYRITNKDGDAIASGKLVISR